MLPIFLQTKDAAAPPKFLEFSEDFQSFVEGKLLLKKKGKSSIPLRKAIRDIILLYVSYAWRRERKGKTTIDDLLSSLFSLLSSLTA